MANVQLPLSIDVLNKKEYKKGSKEASAFAEKFKNQLVVLDPTDENRNVAANVSCKALSRLAIASRALVKNPHKDTFYSKGYSDIMPKRKLSKIRKSLGVNVYALSFRLPDIAEDIVWQQLKKLRHRLEHLIKLNGFAPMLALQNVDERDAVIAFFISDTNLKSRAIEGPSVLMGEACDKFIGAHKGATMFYLKDGRICSIETPKYETPKDLLQKFLLDRKEILPSYLKRKSAKIYVNEMPELYARMVYKAYVWKDIASVS
jgi:tRNA nucleotidyltransferase (CCA-adding enzyme)